MHQPDEWGNETVPSQPARAADSPDPSAPSGLGAIPARIWIMLLLIVILTVVVAGLWGIYLLRDRLSGPIGPTPTPIVWTVTPAPSPTATPTATAEPTPTASAGIAIGRYVQVAGTGGSGLSLREGPGSNYPRVDVALEGEVFIVVEGPSPSGGFQWWRVRDPDNEERVWWAAGNFLEPIERP